MTLWYRWYESGNWGGRGTQILSVWIIFIFRMKNVKRIWFSVGASGPSINPIQKISRSVSICCKSTWPRSKMCTGWYISKFLTQKLPNRIQSPVIWPSSSNRLASKFLPKKFLEFFVRKNPSQCNDVHGHPSYTISWTWVHEQLFFRWKIGFMPVSVINRLVFSVLVFQIFLGS